MIEIEKERVYFRKMGDDAEVELLDLPLPPLPHTVYPDDSWPVKPDEDCKRIRGLISECQGFVDMTISKEHHKANESTWDQYKFFREVIRVIMNTTRYSYTFKQALDIKHIVVVPEIQLGTLNIHVHVNYCFKSNEFIDEKLKLIKSILLSKKTVLINGKKKCISIWGFNPVGISAQVIKNPALRSSYVLKSHSKTSQYITIYKRCAGDGTSATTEKKEERRDVLFSLSDRCAGDGASHLIAPLEFD